MQVKLALLLFVSLITNISVGESLRYTIINDPARVAINLEIKQSIIDKYKSSTINSQKIESIIRDRKSGDDVGNGGDKLRSLIKLDLSSIERSTHYTFPELKDIIIARGVGHPFIKIKIDSEVLYILDKDFWKQAYTQNFDMRPHLMTIFLKIDKHDLLKAYEGLEAKSIGRPYCIQETVNIFIERKSKDFTESENNQSLTSNCNQSQYKDCHVLTDMVSGFAGFAKRKIISRGYKYKTRRLSPKEMKEETCNVALYCQKLALHAPYRQISIQEFKKLNKLVKSYCH